jgi:hypothetical protein
MRERMVCTIIQPKITILQINNRPKSTKRPNEVTIEDLKNLMSIVMSGGHTMGGQVNALIRRMLTFKYLNPRDLMNVLPRRHLDTFPNDHIQRWGDVHC